MTESRHLLFEVLEDLGTICSTCAESVTGRANLPPPPKIRIFHTEWPRVSVASPPTTFLTRCS